MAKRWKKTEVTYLKRYASIRRVDELAERFKTDAATVRAKLRDLGLRAKDTGEAGGIESDPLLATYERAIKAFHQNKRSQAVQMFEKVAAGSDQTELASRARQYLKISRGRSEQQTESADADDFTLAVMERNRGNLDESLTLCTARNRHRKDERFAYLAAAIQSLQGELDKAAATLEVAIELNPKNRIHAFHDPDFEGLRNDGAFSYLFALE